MHALHAIDKLLDGALRRVIARLARATHEAANEER